MSEGADPKNVARGLKASIKNPRVSDAAKENAEERLSDMPSEVNSFSGGDTQTKNTSNRLGGYKATIANPRISKEAKKHAHEVIEGYKKEGEMDDPDYVPDEGGYVEEDEA